MGEWSIPAVCKTVATASQVRILLAASHRLGIYHRRDISFSPGPGFHILNSMIKIAGVELSSPIVIAAGVWTAIPASFDFEGAGAITAKTCTFSPRLGFEGRTIASLGNDSYINAMGLPNPGVHVWLEHLKKAPRKIPLIVSVAGETIDEFVKVVEAVNEAKPDFIELNLSCPNTDGEPYSLYPGNVFRAIGTCKRATKIPLIAKLSPNVSDIKWIAQRAEEAGADAISAVNTMYGYSTLIDRKHGGVSGRALKHLALYCVEQIVSAVKIPVIGIGGILDGADATDMLNVGAVAIGIGSAIMLRGKKAAKIILDEISHSPVAQLVERLTVNQ
jgi:dihydroorotate dehydrogenase (NAD+) catalytic subunit